MKIYVDYWPDIEYYKHWCSILGVAYHPHGVVIPEAEIDGAIVLLKQKGMQYRFGPNEDWQD